MSAVDGLWYSPPTFPNLSLHDIHVWRAALDPPAERILQLANTLSSKERSRAERYYFEKDRQRFIVGRGLLRTILGSYLGIEPAEIQFCYSDRGKPALASSLSSHLTKGEQRGDSEMLRFNLSHSSNVVLYAFAQNREIGIDVERIRSIPEIEKLAERFFATGENAALLALSTEQRIRAFFNCWTRKEAYIKAIGDGLALPLDRFEVTLAPGEPAELVSIEGDRANTNRWSLQELYPGDGYVGAIAVEGCDWQMSCWQWRDY